MRARQLDEAVSQILALHQNEDQEDSNNAGRRQRPQQGRNQRRNILQRGGRRLANLDRYRLGLARRNGLNLRRWSDDGLLRLVELLAEVLKDISGAFERAAGPAAPRNDLIFSCIVNW
jgi:hypothetical protein